MKIENKLNTVLDIVPNNLPVLYLHLKFDEKFAEFLN